MYPPQLSELHPSIRTLGKITPGLAQRSSWSAIAEAEGFEPPVPCGTFAFKVLETPFKGSREAHYRWSYLGTRRHTD
jgi:hypothetical protein